MTSYLLGNEVVDAMLPRKASKLQVTRYRPKTYALQSIWEETSTAVQSYSSFWSNVYVTGVY